MPNSGYYENLNQIVDDLNNDGMKEVKVIKLKPKKGPKKLIMFKGNYRY